MKYLDFLTLYFDGAAGDGGDGGTGGAGTGSGEGAGTGTGSKGAGAGSSGAGTGGTDDGDGDDDRKTPKYSDDDLDRILAKKFSKWQKQQQAAVDEATKLANMSAQERAEHERDKLQKELDALKKANLTAEMEKTARGILSADGVTVPDEIVGLLVGDDAEKTAANVKAFAKAYKKAVQDEVKRQLTHKTPTAGIGSSGSVTKEDIKKEKDPIKRQQMIRENMGLFQK